MGNLGNIYKIYYKMYTEQGKEDETKIEFSGVPLKVRNNNFKYYRYYDEQGRTQSLQKHLLGGVFVDYDLMSETPSITSFFFTEKEENYQKVVDGLVNEQINELKDGLKKAAEEALATLIEKNKKAMEKLVESKKEERNETEQPVAATA